MWREKPGFGPKVRKCPPKRRSYEIWLGRGGGGRWAQLELTDTKRLQKLG